MPRSRPVGGTEPADGSFAQTVIRWQRAHGRHDLPWQRTRDAYRIWVSEVMLQQTQVATVLAYYERFMQRFPDVASLAAAPIDEVLGLWSGLGYYSRARNLHACARELMDRHGGHFPRSAQALQDLPGIGPSTAAAIAAFAWGERAAILDGNVKRVLCRCFGVEGFPGERAVEQQLWALARAKLPAADEGLIESYTQGLMDLGATLCTRTRAACERCPLQSVCIAHRTGRTAQLPAARPRRALALRTAEWAAVLADDAVLLERRMPSGLWGGLWSLPELQAPVAQSGASLNAGQVSHLLTERYGLTTLDPQPAGDVHHAFTHFKLHARVWRINLPARLRRPIDGHEWLRLDAVDHAPLPQPVKTLLQQLALSDSRLADRPERT